MWAKYTPIVTECIIPHPVFSITDLLTVWTFYPIPFRNRAIAVFAEI
jgi:hypothetical protein